jgi:hypothetical protein
MFRVLAWDAFIKRGFSNDDLRLVCKSLRKQVDRGKRSFGSLSFHRLIVDLDNFEELLAEFRALQRKPVFGWGKMEALKSTGRPVEPESPPAKPAKDVIKGLGIAQKLRDFKDKL